MAEDLVKKREPDYAIRKRGLFYRSNYSGYTDDWNYAGRYSKAAAEIEVTIEPWDMAAIPFPEAVKPRAICEGCGSYWTDNDVRAARKQSLTLVSCCPERKPLTIDQWRDRATALEAENARLRADREHMDWLEAHEVQIWAKTDGVSELVIYAEPSQKRPRPNKLRERITAARSALSGKGA